MTLPSFDYYGLFFQSLFEGRINFQTDPMYCMLASTLYAPNQDTHKYVSDVVSGEIQASGYTPGGQEVTGKAAIYQVSGGVKSLLVTGGNLVWPTMTPAIHNPRYGILYMKPQGVGQAQQPLIGYLNFEADATPVDQSFYINWNFAGVFGFSIPVAI